MGFDLYRSKKLDHYAKYVESKEKYSNTDANISPKQWNQRHNSD